nr:PREDICTED: origin recognition complex subunit 3 isoform X1 [Megachile rotundata]
MNNASVSKGVFAYKGSYKIGKKSQKFKSVDYFNEPWYLAYDETWSSIQKAAEDIRLNMFQEILTNLELFVSKIKETPVEQLEDGIQTAVILTGVNVPDHEAMFQKTVSKLESITKHTAVIWNRDTENIKNILEESIYQLINEEENEAGSIKKNQCTMRVLNSWHQKNCNPNDPLLIIITDFESASPAVLHDFILILSEYSSTMKFILIFGVATTIHAIYRCLTYDATSKLYVHIFNMPTQLNTLSDVLENIIFCTEIPFKLTGRAFQLLTDMFLFYDLSVENFIQNYKTCMIQHFYANNVNSLCCKPQQISSRISTLTDEDLEEIKKLPSIEKYIQQLKENERNEEVLENEKFKGTVAKLLNKFHKYMDQFLTVLRCLHDLLGTLPNAPMGKQLREFYVKAVYVKDLRECSEYKNCLELLGFLSKKELLSKLNSLLTIIDKSNDSAMKKLKADLQEHVTIIEGASLDVNAAPADIVSGNEKLTRVQLQTKLYKMSQMKLRSPFKQAQIDVISFLDQHVFGVYLINPNLVPANEIFCFNDGNLAKQHIRGSLRAAIHTALNDPQVYLNCSCCKLENDDAILPTMPDLSIIYKLHLESGKLMNMYDWLQAYVTIVDPNEESKKHQEKEAKLRARFTQAVAELEFLGFIKSSRQKTDHVKRLT